MKLGLGTVQFGLDYGISNTAGKTTEAEIEKILHVAVKNGIHIIDTAAEYGTSEEVLGRRLPAKHDFRIVTKTLRFAAAGTPSFNVKLLAQTLDRSLIQLRCSKVYGLLIHRADDLIGGSGQAVWQKLVELKEGGFVSKIGVSVYTAEQIDAILSRFPIDIVQLPVNVLDQRLLVSGHLSKLNNAGIEIHARSVFLQGLLLMKQDSIPPHFKSIKMHLARYHDKLQKQGITPVRAALGFVTGLKQIDTVICGVNNHQQLIELCAAATPLQSDEFVDYAITDELILNPSLWPK